MKNVVLKRCCGNCEWSISPECEEEIMKENNYDETDPNRPRAGDCCLGREHNGDYVCTSHDYIEAAMETYTFYEDKYAGPGYFVVTEYWENIIKFFKLYRTGTYGNYSYGIRIYEYDPIKIMEKVGIVYEINKYDNEVLYKAITIFAKALGENVIWDIDKKSFMTSKVYNNSTSLYFTGENSNIIDIKIDNIDSRIYKLVEHLYRNMAVTTMNMTNDKVSKKIKQIIKKK